MGSLHTIDEIHDDRLKIQSDERVIHEHTVLKIIAPDAPILVQKCTKIVVGWGSTPDPAGGAYRAHPDPHSCYGPGMEIW